jgi:hypothetical protein
MRYPTLGVDEDVELVLTLTQPRPPAFSEVANLWISTI